MRNIIPLWPLFMLLFGCEESPSEELADGSGGSPKMVGGTEICDGIDNDGDGLGIVLWERIIEEGLDDPLDAVGRRGVRRGAGQACWLRLLRPQLEVAEDLLEHVWGVPQSPMLRLTCEEAAEGFFGLAKRRRPTISTI